jgi:hypothetical protein
LTAYPLGEVKGYAVGSLTVKKMGKTDRVRLQGIMKLLAASVKSGLNATLTPLDSKELIVLLTTRSVSPKATHIDRIVDKLGTIAEEAFDALGDEFRKGKL